MAEPEAPSLSALRGGNAPGDTENSVRMGALADRMASNMAAILAYITAEIGRRAAADADLQDQITELTDRLNNAGIP